MKNVRKYICIIFILNTILIGCSNKESVTNLQYGKFSCKAEDIGYASIEVGEDYAMFCYSMFSSYIVAGNYEVENDKLVITDSLAPDNKYMFEIKDDALIFLPKESADLPSCNEVDWKNMVFRRIHDFN